MSYTSYDYADLQLNTDEIDSDGTLRVTVKITNSGEVTDEEVAHLYVGTIGSHVEWPVKELKGFNKVELEAGETKEVAFDLSARQLGNYDEGAGKWVVEPITYQVYVGPLSRPEDLLAGEFGIKC